MDRRAELALARRAKRGDLEARNAIIVSLWPFVYSEARRLSTRWQVPQMADDLAQCAIIRVIEKFKAFDPRRGVRPISYFGIVAFNAMRSFRRTDGLIHLPNVINPEATHLKEKAATARAVKRLTIVHADSILEQRAPVNVPVLDEYDERRIKRAVRAMGRLPPRLAYIVQQRMEGKFLRELGEELGVSRERIRQLEKRALAILRKELC